MSVPRSGLRRWIVPAAFLVVAAIIVYAKYPGMMGTDALAQYRQIVSGDVDDWQPPVMVRVWRLLLLVSRGGGGGPIYLLHALFYWGGFSLLVGTLALRGRGIATGAVALIALVPSSVFLTAEISKDVGLAGAFVAASALLYAARKSQGRNRIVEIAAACLILYGTLIRTNAVFAAPPLIVYLLWPQLVLRPWRLIGVSVGLAAVLIPVSSIVNHDLLKARDAGALRSLLVFDMAGIETRSGDATILKPDSAGLLPLQACYTPVLWDPLGVDACDYMHRLGGDAPRRWIAAIAAHPIAYAGHRLTYMRAAINTHYLRHIRQDQSYDWNYFLDITPQDARERWIQRGLTLVVFKPVFAFLLGLSALALLRRPAVRSTSEGTLAFCLAISGLGYFLGYALVGVASEFRYFLWSMIAMPIALVAAIVAAREQGKPSHASKTAWYLGATIAVAAGLLQLCLPTKIYAERPGILLDRHSGLPVPPLRH